MASRSDNTPLDEDVTDSAELSEDDTPEDADYFDPDEDHEEADDEAGTDDEPDEEEGEADTAEADDQEADAEPVYADEKAKVKLPDGTEAPVAELIQGNMRQQDYTRKTQELANDRKAVAADVERMQRITEAFVDHISALVPDAPDASLALSDPNAYTAQKAQHEAAMAQVQKLIEAGKPRSRSARPCRKLTVKSSFKRQTRA